MLPEGLVTYLLAQPTVTAIIGDRLQPNPPPEQVDSTTYPCVAYTVPSDVPQERALDGSYGGLQMRIVFDCFGLRFLDAANLARAVNAVLDGFIGTLPDGTVCSPIEATLSSRFDDGSRIYCWSVHAIVHY